MPVVGNGDLMRHDDIDKMLAQTGCQAVMVGRGAIGNPWLLARLDKESLSFVEVSRVISDHLIQMVAYHGQRGVILFRKHVKRYLAGMPLLQPYYRKMVSVKTVEEFQMILAEAADLYGGYTMQDLSG